MDNVRARWSFWGAVALFGYTWLGFPVLVALRAAFRRRPVKCAAVAPVPSVSLIVAAHNEASVIDRKLENLLALRYDRERLEIIVVSDGSTDETNDIVASYTSRGIRLLALPRVGKAAALNAAVAESCNDILVFSDANSLYDPDAVMRLVEPFCDPDVGGVAGDQRYRKDGMADLAAGEHRFWDLDRALKMWESAAGSAISATGAIYAIRRELFAAVPEGVTDDFFVSTGVVTARRRLVFAPRAVAWEPAATSGALEFERKVRVITRGLRAIILRRDLLNPAHHGFYALQLVSHKLLRRLTPVPLVILGVSTLRLRQAGLVYQAALVAQAGLYGTGVVGLWRAAGGMSVPRVVRLPAYFCLANAACVRALLNVAGGRSITRWEPRRGQPADATLTAPASR